MTAALLSWWCARRSWVSVCHPAAVLHGRPIALSQSARSFTRALVTTPFQSVPFSPVPNTKKTSGSSHFAVLIWKTKNLLHTVRTRIILLVWYISLISALWSCIVSGIIYTYDKTTTINITTIAPKQIRVTTEDPGTIHSSCGKAGYMLLMLSWN